MQQGDIFATFDLQPLSVLSFIIWFVVLVQVLFDDCKSRQRVSLHALNSTTQTLYL